MYNAANEVCVDLFLEGRIGYTDIFLLMESAVAHFENNTGELTLESIINADSQARKYVSDLCGENR